MERRNKTIGKLKGGAGGSVSRKELRKAHKQAAKEKKQQRHLLKQVRLMYSRCVQCIAPEFQAGGGTAV